MCRSLGCHVFSHPQPSSQSCPNDTDQTGYCPQEHHSVAQFHTVGTTEIAQGGLAALGGNGHHSKVCVGLRTVCRTFLGYAISHVFSKPSSTVCGCTVILMFFTLVGFKAVPVGVLIFTCVAKQGGSFLCCREFRCLAYRFGALNFTKWPITLFWNLPRCSFNFLLIDSYNTQCFSIIWIEPPTFLSGCPLTQAVDWYPLRTVPEQFQTCCPTNMLPHFSFHLVFLDLFLW